ncbi:MAG: ABC transporter ATP-binding protein [Gammaproteobacteria bacterium]|nr:ABC transporter ATP-binding protein [Gammaproteobacteria bacterium]
MTFALECRSLSKRFGSFSAVSDVSFTISEGSFFSILGPSGCGKTTLLRMISGFCEPDKGDIVIHSRSMRGILPNARPVNMVFQQLALFPMMTVFENIAYGLRCRKVSKKKISFHVEEVLNRVGLAQSGSKKIDQLSGGQKQRVAIARCLVLEPKILLLDEPLGALDLKLREHMKIELKKLQTQLGTTFLYITHDQSEALVMSSHIAVMKEGRIEQIGTPQALYQSPKSSFVAQFVGDNNHWRGKIVQFCEPYVEVQTEEGWKLKALYSSSFQVGDRVDIFVRPEAMLVKSGEKKPNGWVNCFEGLVSSVVFNGGTRDLWVNVRGGNGSSFSKELKVTLPAQKGDGEACLPSGRAVEVGWDALSSHVLKVGVK